MADRIGLHIADDQTQEYFCKHIRPAFETHPGCGPAFEYLLQRLAGMHRCGLEETACKIGIVDTARDDHAHQRQIVGIEETLI